VEDAAAENLRARGWVEHTPERARALGGNPCDVGRRLRGLAAACGIVADGFGGRAAAGGFIAKLRIAEVE
jgi:hypothetical protein